MEYDDPTFLGFMAAVNRNMKIGAKLGIVGFIPWLRMLMPDSWLGVNLMTESLVQINDYFVVNDCPHEPETMT